MKLDTIPDKDSHRHAVNSAYKSFYYRNTVKILFMNYYLPYTLCYTYWNLLTEIWINDFKRVTNKISEAKINIG